MKIKEIEVHSKGELLGTVEYEEFDSIQEAVETLGENTALSLINSQHCTNKRNAFRSAKTSTPSKKKMFMEVVSTLTSEELQSVAGDPAALEELVNAKVEKKLQEMTNEG